MSTTQAHPRDPLYGIKLKDIVTRLVEKHGWEAMGRRIAIRCFLYDPSINSSLKFLRRTPWARKKVEDWYISEIPDREIDEPLPQPSKD